MRSAEVFKLRASHYAKFLKSCLGFGLGFTEAGDSVTRFPLPALFEECDSLKAFHNVAFCAGCTGGAQTAMLCHKL
jgi:hypothetical protein